MVEITGKKAQEFLTEIKQTALGSAEDEEKARGTPYYFHEWYLTAATAAGLCQFLLDKTERKSDFGERKWTIEIPENELEDFLYRAFYDIAKELVKKKVLIDSLGAEELRSLLLNAEMEGIQTTHFESAIFGAVERYERSVRVNLAETKPDEESSRKNDSLYIREGHRLAREIIKAIL